jgi:hypothetical protein
MTAELGLDEVAAQRLLETLLELYSEQNPPDAAIMDGGFDGVARLQDRDASRLLKHYGVSDDDQFSPEQVEAFRTFHNRDRFSSPRK